MKRDSSIAVIGYGGGYDEALPFAVTTRIAANNQQYLKVYEKNEEDTNAK